MVLKKNTWLKYRMLKLLYGKKVLPAYWFDGVSNFGDMLNKELLKHFGYYPFHVQPEEAAFVGIGSILQIFPDDYRGVILGSGFINGQAHATFRNANILALRGELTKELAGIKADVVLADAGLLVSELYSKGEKKHVIGIVPHYVDARLPIVEHIRKLAPGRILTIDVSKSPERVCRDISSCEHIISSSLHGLIVADSFGIPNRWMALSSNVGAEGFKFRDYYSAFGESRTPLLAGYLGSAGVDEILKQTVCLNSPAMLHEKKMQLKELFESLGNYLEVM